MAAYKIAAVKEDVRERGFRRGDRGFGREGSSGRGKYIGGRAWIPTTRLWIRDKSSGGTQNSRDDTNTNTSASETKGRNFRRKRRGFGRVVIPEEEEIMKKNIPKYYKDSVYCKTKKC